MSNPINSADVIKGQSLFVRGLGGDPVAFAQASFNAVWDAIPHILPFVSNQQRDAVNKAIELIVNKSLAE